MIDAIMSIPPLLSSTPPPLEENGSIHDHDDDFGEFSDHASAGAVSSETSIADSSSVFRPIETAGLSGGNRMCEANVKPDILQETDEWSEFGSAVVQPSFEPVCTETFEMFKDQTLAADESMSDCIGDPPVCSSYEGGTGELSTLSPSTSHMQISEQLNLRDVSTGCCSDAEIVCNHENLYCEEQTVGQFDRNLCESVNTVSEDVHPQCEVEEMKHPVDEESETSCSASDNCGLECDSTVDPVMQETDSEHSSDDNNSFHVSSTIAVLESSEHAFANDNRPASDEEDFVDDFQSFSSDIETQPDSVLEEVLPSVSTAEHSAFVSQEEQEASTCIETSAVVNVHLTDSEPVGISCDFSSSSVKDSATAANVDEIVSTAPHLPLEQILASGEEPDDDFDDFEEFVAAKEGPTEHQSVIDSNTHHWNAFENTDVDGDDWAAFQDFDQPVSVTSRGEVSDSPSNVASIEQPAVAYSGQLSKVRRF